MHLGLTPNSQSQPEQDHLLLSTKSIEVLKKVKDDSSSLLCLRNAGSFRSSWTATTDTSVMLDAEFSFDGEVQQSRAYLGQQKSLIKKAVRKPKSNSEIGGTGFTDKQKGNSYRSRAPKAVLNLIVKSSSPELEIKTLLVEAQDLGRDYGQPMSSTMAHLALPRLKFGPEARNSYKGVVFAIIHDAIKWTLEAMTRAAVQPACPHTEDHMKIMLVPADFHAFSCIPRHLSTAIAALWTDPIFIAFYKVRRNSCAS